MKLNPCLLVLVEIHWRMPVLSFCGTRCKKDIFPETRYPLPSLVRVTGTMIQCSMVGVEGWTSEKAHVSFFLWAAAHIGQVRGTCVLSHFWAMWSLLTRQLYWLILLQIQIKIQAPTTWKFPSSGFPQPFPLLQRTEVEIGHGLEEISRPGCRGSFSNLTALDRAVAWLSLVSSDCRGSWEIWSRWALRGKGVSWWASHTLSRVHF